MYYRVNHNLSKDYVYTAFIINISISFVSGIFPLFDDETYLPVQGWCWFQKKKNPFRFGLFYGPVWLIIILNTLTMIYIYKKLKVRYENAGLDIIRRLKVYPFILLFCFLPISVVRILDTFEFNQNNNPYIVFTIWAMMTLRLLGFFNAIAYGLTDEVYSILNPVANNSVKVQRVSNSF